MAGCPHILADLVLVRIEGDQLVETLRLSGLSNHRTGDAFISGGCAIVGQIGGVDLMLAPKDWTRGIRVKGGRVEDIGPMPATGLAVPPC